MSSIRNLKKDINFLASELFTDCYVKQLLHEDADKEQIAKIMVEAVNFKAEFIARANHPDGKDNRKLVKAFFQNLRKDMYARFMELTDNLNKA
ncbi:hypothetical protein DMA11_15360 [Marinilabiliaceae bacterium JC017]|nr:hypothetical protein DMA11_15360 [Marinilabiliaceae bacterium JC017]